MSKTTLHYVLLDLLLAALIGIGLAAALVQWWSS